MKIYVASSWRNAKQPVLVKFLRDEWHQVYDFRNPPGQTGFSWSEVDDCWMKWGPESFKRGLTHPIAERGFAADRAGMDWAQACVLLLPSGRSAHLEAGYMAGQGKPVVVYMPEPVEPELMYLLFGNTSHIVGDGPSLSRMLKGIERGWVTA